jgi:hypothetical protein
VKRDDGILSEQSAARSGEVPAKQADGSPRQTEISANMQATAGIARRKDRLDIFNIATFAVRVKPFSTGFAKCGKPRGSHLAGRRPADLSGVLLGSNIDFFLKPVHKLMQYPYPVPTL